MHRAAKYGTPVFYQAVLGVVNVVVDVVVDVVVVDLWISRRNI